jgi:hypothetical protein
MFDKFKQLLGLDPTTAVLREDFEQDSGVTEIGGSALISRYFALSEVITRAKSAGNFPEAVKAARDTYEILPAVVQEWMEDGGIVPSVSNAVHTAPALMAVLENEDAIAHLRRTLQGCEPLHGWLGAGDQAQADLALVKRLMAEITRDAGLAQSSLKKQLGLANASRASQLVAWLEKGGRLFRVKSGSTYRLYPAGFAMDASSAGPSTSPSPKTSASYEHQDTLRRRVDRAPRKARLLKLDGLPIVRLPMAPAYWEERDQRARQAKDSDSATDNLSEERKTEQRFTVEGTGWHVEQEDKLAPAERPDPSFKKAFHTGTFTYWLDPKGKRDGFEFARSVLRVTGGDGEFVAEHGLAHDVYREDVSANGSAILFLSREGILHGYSETLVQLIEEDLAKLPEYAAQADRFGIEPGSLKNHVRCVAITSDCSSYLVTIVDEAWSVDLRTGQTRWGVRFPSKEGWTRRVVERSAASGTSVEVRSALRLMELDLPVSPDDIVQQYRKLAARWHPDRNPGDQFATSKFQELGSAVELLTGADVSSLTRSAVERVTYEQILWTSGGQTDIPLGMTITASLVVGEAFASDWIYAANLSNTGRAFLGGYSGKVVVLSPDGEPERVYDIGAVPRQVLEVGDRIYILTDTRLYVLLGDQLENLTDAFGAKLIVADNGFALLEEKALTWFAPDGTQIGTARTKDPIRRVYHTGAFLIVETRQHRARINGCPRWWSSQ